MGELVRAMEPHFSLVECMTDGGDCRLDGICALKGMLANANLRFLEALDEHTLADIVGPARRHRRKLGVADLVGARRRSS